MRPGMAHLKTQHIAIHDTTNLSTHSPLCTTYSLSWASTKKNKKRSVYTKFNKNNSNLKGLPNLWNWIQLSAFSFPLLLLFRHLQPHFRRLRSDHKRPFSNITVNGLITSYHYYVPRLVLFSDTNLYTKKVSLKYCNTTWLEKFLNRIASSTLDYKT